MYDEYRTVPSEQATDTPWKRKRRDTLLHALVRSPREVADSSQASLRDLLDRSAAWEARRDMNRRDARAAREDAEPSDYDFQPRILLRVGSHDARAHRRSPSAYYAAQCEWQQQVAEKTERLRRKEAELAEQQLAQDIGAAQRVREANKAHVPLQSYVPPTEPKPRTDVPQPSPRTSSRGKRQSAHKGGSVRAVSARVRRQRRPPSPITHANAGAESTCSVVTPAVRPSSAVKCNSPLPHRNTRTTARRTPRRVRAASAVTMASPATTGSPRRRLTHSEEADLVARLLDENGCQHASHTRCHATQRSSGRGSPRVRDGSAFLARQALWSLKTRIRAEEARESVAARRAEAWQRDCSFTPQVSPRSKLLAAQYAQRLEAEVAAARSGEPEGPGEAVGEGTSFRSAVSCNLTPVQRLAIKGSEDGSGDAGVNDSRLDRKENAAVEGVNGARSEASQPWTSQDAVRAAAQLAYSDRRVQRLRSERVKNPVRRVLGYTDISQLRLASPPRRPRRTVSQHSAPAGCDVDGAVASRRTSPSSFRSEAPHAVAAEEEPGALEASRTSSTVRSWPTPPSAPVHPRTSVARLDECATQWIAEAATSPLASLQWVASSSWSEMALPRTERSALWDDEGEHGCWQAPPHKPLNSQPCVAQIRPGVVSPSVSVAPPHPSGTSSSACEDHSMLMSWWRRLSCDTPPVPHGPTAYGGGVSLERVLGALQQLLDQVGTRGLAVPRLGFEPLFLDIPVDVCGVARRFSVYLVLPNIEAGTVRVAYHLPLPGTLDFADFDKLYRWLLDAGAVLQERAGRAQT